MILNREASPLDLCMAECAYKNIFSNLRAALQGICEGRFEVSGAEMYSAIKLPSEDMLKDGRTPMELSSRIVISSVARCVCWRRYAKRKMDILAICRERWLVNLSFVNRKGAA